MIGGQREFFPRSYASVERPLAMRTEIPPARRRAAAAPTMQAAPLLLRLPPPPGAVLEKPSRFLENSAVR
jgi:hypothetical protein